MNENVKILVLELCSFLLDEELPEDSNLEEVLRRAINNLENSVFFRQETWEKDKNRSSVH